MSDNSSQADIYASRRKALAEYLEKNRISAAVLRDFEGNRCSSVRYLSGHPQDAVLFVFSTGKSILVPWDVILAQKFACADEILPYTDYNRNFTEALKNIIKDENTRIAISSSTPYPEVINLSEEMTGLEIICDKNGFELFIESIRKIKDSSEIAALRAAAEITNQILDQLGDYIQSSSGITETDITFFIEKYARKKGAEGTGFETIAASPHRSWGIHPYPSYSNAGMAGSGLSIIDFGIRYSGYTTDVTAAIACGPLSPKQEKMVFLVEEAALTAESVLKNGENVRTPAEAVNNFFKSYGYKMPHSLGHGIGLDVHEKPFIKDSEPENELLQSGMVISIEPGLYLPGEGGVRLENNYLITETGCEKLTSSRIFRINQTQK